MRIAPDLTWTAFAGIACAAIVAMCASIAIATGADWTTQPAFSASVTGGESALVRAIEQHFSSAAWAPQRLDEPLMHVNGTSSGYLVRLDESRSFGASVIGRAAAYASVLDIAGQRHRFFWSGSTTTIALTRSVVATVTHHGDITNVLWRERDWTIEATDAGKTGYSLARDVEAFVASHSWPTGPGYLVVERGSDGMTTSWSQWADGDAVVGASDLNDAFGAVRMTSSMRRVR
jgi:hypothetical protein